MTITGQLGTTDVLEAAAAEVVEHLSHAQLVNPLTISRCRPTSLAAHAMSLSVVAAAEQWVPSGSSRLTKRPAGTAKIPVNLVAENLAVGEPTCRLLDESLTAQQQNQILLHTKGAPSLGVRVQPGLW